MANSHDNDVEKRAIIHDPTTKKDFGVYRWYRNDLLYYEKALVLRILTANGLISDLPQENLKRALYPTPNPFVESKSAKRANNLELRFVSSVARLDGTLIEESQRHFSRGDYVHLEDPKLGIATQGLDTELAELLFLCSKVELFFFEHSALGFDTYLVRILDMLRTTKFRFGPSQKRAPKPCCSSASFIPTLRDYITSTLVLKGSSGYAQLACFSKKVTRESNCGKVRAKRNLRDLPKAITYWSSVAVQILYCGLELMRIFQNSIFKNRTPSPS
ncbi:uncharacterized protein BDR25DRAFT_348536 [Lindgomyces ingoldianus]|uniref:Uncharacterized protein n=1 Tax=Lindgomyces ingoldianus TaxID=673940 RepID=A0ACB6RG86_9PLEO|nr:uncharacterized protein BDR25DRAFT_348536 [Lindgomyces ingoldianus]KAF2478269.1 hypothetical protein BDR25DRAFT_348536 [Lindgomyces ingoldianus]